MRTLAILANTIPVVMRRTLASLRFWRMLEAGLPALVIYEEMQQRLRIGAEGPADGPVGSLPTFTRSLSFRDVGLRTPDGRQALDGVELVPALLPA